MQGESICVRIRRLRVEAGLSQHEAACRAWPGSASENARQRWAQYEARKVPGLTTIGHLAQALGVTPGTLIEGVREVIVEKNGKIDD